MAVASKEGGVGWARLSAIGAIALSIVGSLIYGGLYVGELKGRVDALDPRAIEAARVAAVHDIESRLARMDDFGALKGQLQSDIAATQREIEGVRDTLHDIESRLARMDDFGALKGQLQSDIAATQREVEGVRDKLSAYRAAMTSRANYQSFTRHSGGDHKRLMRVDEAFCYLAGVRLKDSTVESSAYVYFDAEIGYWMLGGALVGGESETRGGESQVGNGAVIDRAYANCIRYPAP